MIAKTGWFCYDIGRTIRFLGGISLKTVDLSALCQMDYAIMKVVAMYQYWGTESSFTYEDRPWNGLMYLLDGSMSIKTEKGRKEAPQGSLCYIPQHCRYTAEFSDCHGAGPHDILINFLLYDEGHTPFSLSEEVQIIFPRNGSYYADAFRQIAGLFSNGSLLPGRIKALLYALLTDISLEVRHARLRGKSYASIWPAIEYLEKNFLKSPSISELARMCSVSESCFRRLFKEYAGMAPLEYILRLKLNRARLLLENGSLTVGEAAAAAGFDDPAYFSRLYKQKTGVSPIETLRGRF